MKNLWIYIIIALLVGGFVGYYLSNPSLYAGQTQSVKADTISKNEQNFRMAMRKLWEDHIIWTRSYIVSAASDLEDQDEVAARLLKNQEDIGNAIKPYYGDEAGNKLTELLKAHITTAVELVDAAKKGDDNALNTANTKWYDNANQIADFLSQANPNNWPQNELRSHMKNHLDLTKQEAVDVINQDHNASITGFDRIHEQILTMADLLSSGIIKQFPDKF